MRLFYDRMIKFKGRMSLEPIGMRPWRLKGEHEARIGVGKRKVYT